MDIILFNCCEIVNLLIDPFELHSLKKLSLNELKLSLKNRGCGLSARTSGHRVINLHKLTLSIKCFISW